MKKALNSIKVLLNLAIVAMCLLLIVRLMSTNASLIEPAAFLLLFIAAKNSMEVLLTV